MALLVRWLLLCTGKLCENAPEVTAIVIDPLNSNTDALRFYQRLGFRIVGRRTFDGDDCLVHRLDRAVWQERTR